MYKIYAVLEGGERVLYSKAGTFNDAVKHFKECWKEYGDADSNSIGVIEVAHGEMLRE